MNTTDYDEGDDGDYGPFPMITITEIPKSNFMKEFQKRGRALRRKPFDDDFNLYLIDLFNNSK